ncbi:MAG: nitrile hydratase subunit beta [Parvibaculaceae bacterium]
MNGPHDLGGQMGFGPIAPEKDEPVFHAEWERRAMALTVASGALRLWNADISRHSRERIDPATYLAASYYEKWIRGLSKLLVEYGLATETEIAAGHMNQPPAKVTALAADKVAAVLARGNPANRTPAAKARFAVGDKVRTRNINPKTHTRLPRYARARLGEIVLVHGAHVFPDSNAQRKGEDPQWLYTVRFAARELWGEDRNPHDSVQIDLWEPYLEPV